MGEEWWELHFGMRWTAVEELVFPFTQSLREFRPDNMTLVVPHWKLEADPPRRFVATQAGQLPVDLLTFAHDHTAAFFAQYANLGAIDQLFNAEPERHQAWLRHDLHRAVRGLGVHYIANAGLDVDLYRRHRSRLLERLVATHDLDRLDRLAAHLQALSPN